MREFHTTVSTGRSPRSLIARRRSGIESQDPSQLTGSLRVIARIARVNGPGAKLPYGDRSTAVIVGCGLKVVGLWVGGAGWFRRRLLIAANPLHVHGLVAEAPALARDVNKGRE